MIRRLAYVSRPRPDLPSAEIPRIVLTSRANNTRDRVTGVLVYTGTDFAQLIEGEAARVEALWQRIRADDRHLDVTPLLDETDTAPWFQDWRMGYLGDRTLARKFAEWRGLDHAIGERERSALRTLLATADAL